MSSKYPKQLDLFQTKRNAEFEGDPNGDFVMAEDINELHDAIGAIEGTLGINPQGNKMSVSDRITLLEGSSVLRVPPFLLYLGNPAEINGATSISEAVSEYLKYDHIVFGNNAQSWEDTDHETTKVIIQEVQANRDVKFYGHIDCGVLTVDLSISEIQNRIQAWNDMDVSGIYCGNFGFEGGSDRDRQNLILDSIHQHGLVAIVNSDDPTEVLSNPFHDLNPGQVMPNIKSGDTYHYEDFVISTVTGESYENPTLLLTKLEKLQSFRRDLGIRILATPVITSDITAAAAAEYFEYAHAVALLGSVDMFHPVIESYGETTNFNRTYSVPSIVGDWYVTDADIVTIGSTHSRETTFGKITVDSATHSYNYDGLYIPYDMLRIAADSIDGTLLKDATIEDQKIKSYDGQRLVTSINGDLSAEKINISKIAAFEYGDIDGAIPVDHLKANVVEAINAYIGTATIGEAKIGNLSAGKITAGTIDAERITASVVDAVNLYAQNMEVGSAVIGEAAIGNLNADKITAGTIDAERITASVVDAINLSAKQADIENLNADNITAGDIKADRIQTNVIHAINTYTDSLVANKAMIKSAAIGNLTAGHIQTEVINAINARIGTATIDAAAIGSLDADNIKAAVITAINASIETAQIDQAKIGELSADKITAGDIDADRLKATVLTAINASIATAKIDQAQIGNLDADKITTGDLDAERIEAQVLRAFDLYAQKMTVDSATMNTAVIGALDAKHMQAAVVEAINATFETATINAAKIGELKAENIQTEVIKAVNASIEIAKISQAQIGDLDAEKITAGDIAAERLKASVITAINGTFETIKIESGTIGELSVDNMKAGVIEAVNANITGTARIESGVIGELKAENIQAEIIKAINASIEVAVIDSAQVGTMSADHIAAAVIEAINAKITTATIDNAVVGSLGVDNMKGVVVEAVNSYTGTAVIGQAKIGNLDAKKITTGDLESERIKANVVNAINASIDELNATHATIDSAAIGSLKADNIKVEIIQAINASIENAVIDSAQIGSLTAEHIKTSIFEAINGRIGTATIDSAKIGELAADRISGAVIQALEANVGTAVINEALIQTLNAGKITGGQIDAKVMTANIVSAINSEFQTATIDAAKIGSLKAENIEAEIIKAINASIEVATIDSANIGTLTTDHMKVKVLDAINASIETVKIKEGQIQDLTAEKITTGQIKAEVLTTNVVNAINADLQTAVINQAKIGELSATKITSDDIDALRIKANAIDAINAYISDTLITNKAVIDSAAVGTLSADHMQTKVLSAINASIETIDAKRVVIDQAKIGELSVDHIKASVVEAINLNATTAQIDEGKIKDLTAEKIVTGNLKAEVMTTNAISAINADLTTATIDAAQVGSLTAEHIQAQVIEAINASIEVAVIESAKVGALDADHIKTTVIDAINANITGTAKIDGAVIGELKAESIQTEIIKAINASIELASIDSAQIGTLSADHIKTSVVEAINLKATTAKIEAARIGALTAEHITAGKLSADVMQTNVIFAINGHMNSATIQAAKIGKLTAANIDAGIITSDHIVTTGLDASTIKTGQFYGDRIVANSIDATRIISGSITGREIAAHTLTAREIMAGSITASEIQAGSITAEHISTVGLDAQTVTVYDSKTGETLIGGGYLRVDGLDAGVVQSDNLAANGMFMTASSSFGNKRRNPAGEVIIGTESQVPGGNEIWKYDLETGALITQIDVPGKKPAFIAIDGQQQYAYITVQGDDTLVQLDLAYDTITENSRPMGKAPTRVKFTGDLLGDMKHLFVVNTDKTDLNAPDSFFIMDVPPHSDFSQLYIHHQVITGNTPYDFVVSERDKKVYITLADQGDIAILDASDFPTYKWKLEGAIPISPYGTDNYHGGMSAGYGLGTAVGGDSSASYNKGGHAGMSHGGHGGYAVSDGTMKEYKPHGISIDPNENLLVVTEVEHNELVVINRIDEERFDWPTHKSYVENAAWIGDVRNAIAKYDNNPELAIADGYTLVSPWVPFMGYHFANTNPAAYSEQVPNTVMYIFDTTVNQYRLTGAEWLVSDPSIPSPVPGEDWKMAQPSMAHYADGLMIVGIEEADAPQTHPETGSPLVAYSAAIYGIHFFSTIENPLGLFESFNPRLDKYNDKQPQFPPGFESYVDPNMPDSNYQEYQSPEGSLTDGATDGAHAHSVETEETTFSIQAGGHDMPGMDDGGDTIGPDTTGEGLAYKYVRHRIPIGDNPESIIFAQGKIWVTLRGSNQIAVMDETDLYRTTEDFAQGAKWSDYLRYIEVGSKPIDMVPDDARMKIYITVQGDNKIAVVDMINETLLESWVAGANVTSGDITPDGKYLYVTNNGGVGELSFVYPEGAYIGDAFIGLEGDVQYQGGQFWTPDRSDWVFNPDGTLRSSATVEFRINEPFLNEGGYVKLATQGLDQQHASIEQDIFNADNHSNGSNYSNAVAEKLEGTSDLLKWYPNNKWMDGSVMNVKAVWMDAESNRIESIPEPSSFVVHYSSGQEDPETGAIIYSVPHIEFLSVVVPEDGWIEADYEFRANVWFKNHNASTLLAIENSSSRNFNTFFEVDEFVPKFISMDNQQTAAFDYAPIVNPGVTNAHYKGVQYSIATNRALNAPLTSISTNTTTAAGDLLTIVDGVTDSALYYGTNSAESFKLQVTAAPTANGDATITVDGVAQSVPVTSTGYAEKASLGITSAPTAAGSITITLDGINTTVSVDPAVEATATAVADKIRATAFTGWTTGGTAGTTTVTFTATNVGWKTAAGFAAGTTGVTASMVTVTEGENPDTVATVAQRVAQLSFAGWTVTSSSDTATFTALANGNKQLATYSAGTTGATGTITVTNEGVAVGPEHIEIDLGAKYMLGKIKVWHFWQDMRTYHGTKTEVSEDGITWLTVFDSAVDGEYMESEIGHDITFWGYPNKPKNMTDNFIKCVPIRYIRDTIDGNTVNANNHWVEIKAFADWEFEENHLYPAGSTKEGQQIATNGRGVVTTNIAGASATINLKIDFTSWWYMTYLVGPEFGSFDVEMPTVMGGSHVLPLDNPYINKVAHRHIMSWPPGYHRAVVKQRSGKVAIDRFRFEDYQYYDRSATRIPSTADTSFTRYKIVPEQARDYVGSGNQSTHGAYDTPRVNPDTQLPDDSVSIKYRFRIKSILDAGGVDLERGIAYLTSAVFEQGKLSTHWRPSSSSDNTPGNRIESWDGNQPHRTGIQWFHLANGAVRGAKILPSAIMDYHVSPYARIGEYKLDLNHPTHQHGHVMAYADGTQYFMDNKSVIDTIMGWGTSGTQNVMARADHSHPHIMHDMMIHGKLEVVVEHDVDGVNKTWNTINGIELVGFKSAFDTHVAASDLHFTAAERTKLTGLTSGANIASASSVNGNILIDGAQTIVYTHPATDGSLHVPTTGLANDGRFLKAGASAGAIAWADMTWADIQNKPTVYTPPIATTSVLGGVKKGNGLDLTADGVISWSHPTGDGNLHVPATGTTNAGKVIKAGSGAGSIAWGQVQFSELGGGLSAMQHGQLGGGSMHAVATTAAHGFQSAADKTKLDAIEASATNQASGDARYLQLTGGKVDGALALNGLLDVGTTFASSVTATFAGTTASSFKVVNDDGYVQFTPFFTGWAHIATDLSNFVFNKPVYSASNIFGSYDADMVLRRIDIAKLTLGDTVATFTTSVTAPTFRNASGVEVSYEGHRHANASAIADGFMSTVDFTKLAGVAANANNYVHPSSHSIDMIVETTAKKVMTSMERSKLSGIETSANNYIHPSTHSLSMITETIDFKVLTAAERTKLAGIEGNAINQASADNRYLKLTGGTLTGHTRLQGGNNPLALQKDTARTGNLWMNFRNELGTEIAWIGYGNGTDDHFSITNGIAGADLKLVTSGGNVLANGNVVWHAGNLAKSEFATAGHRHANATTTVDGFIAAADKSKLDTIESNAINMTTTDGRYVKLTGSTVTGSITSTSNSPLISKYTGQKSWVMQHPVSNEMIFAPSATIDGVDWDWTKQFTLLDNGDVKVSRNIVVAGLVDGVDVSGLKADFDIYASNTDAHVGNGDVHFSATERTKLAAIEENAINQATADGRFLQLTGGALSGDLTISNTQNARIVLNADTDNDAAETGEPIVVLTQDGGIVGAEIKLSQGGANNNTLVLAPFMDYDTASPVKNYNVFVHDKKVWHEGNLAKSEFATAGHTHSNASISVHGFMSANDKTKLDSVAANANNYAHPSTHPASMIVEAVDKRFLLDAERTKLSGIEANANNYLHPTSHSLNMIDETADLKIMTAAERTKLMGIADNANNYVHPATHSLNMITETTTKKVLTDVERTKLADIEANANNYVHPATHSLDVITETTDKKILTSAERTKLAGVATSANNYAHPTGDGNLHVPATSTTNSAKVLKAGATAGSMSWAQVDWAELTGKPTAFNPTTATVTVLGGITVGDNLSVDANGRLSALNSYVHPTGDGNKHVPADGGTNVNKVLKGTTTAGAPAWGSVAYSELTGVPSTFAPSTHGHAISDVSNLSSELTAKVAKSGNNTLTGTNTFSNVGVGVSIQPATDPATVTDLFQLKKFDGTSTLITMDSDGNMRVKGNLTVEGTQTTTSSTTTDGDFTINGNLSATGATTLGDGIDQTTIRGTIVVQGASTLGASATDTTTVKGDLRIEGDFIPTGKYLEVARFPVYGVAGDPQFQTENLNSHEDIVDHISTFDAGGASCLPAVATGASRYYKLMVAYSNTGLEGSVIRIVQNDGTTEIFSEVLPSVNGTVLNKARTWMSTPFSTLHTGDTFFQAMKNTGGALAIRYIEVIAYDYFN